MGERGEAVRRVRVVLVESREIVRAGLKGLLSRDSDIEVVGIASNGSEGLGLVDRLHPDVSIVDYDLPDMNGAKMCERIVQMDLQTTVVILNLGAFPEDKVIKDAIQAGARSYIDRDVEAKDLKRIILAASRGEAILDLKVAEHVVRWVKGAKRKHGDAYSLSNREVEVLHLLAKGVLQKDMAVALGVSRNTVNTYVQRIYTKLGCRNRTEASAIAAQKSLI